MVVVVGGGGGGGRECQGAHVGFLLFTWSYDGYLKRLLAVKSFELAQTVELLMQSSLQQDAPEAIISTQLSVKNNCLVAQSERYFSVALATLFP